VGEGNIVASSQHGTGAMSLGETRDVNGIDDQPEELDVWVRQRSRYRHATSLLIEKKVRLNMVIWEADRADMIGQNRDRRHNKS
jgi:thiamine phosphate synthase YjbQ (UPF0047 family)